MTDQPSADGAIPRNYCYLPIDTAKLSGTGLLADDLYLMAHDDVTGRAFLHPRALSLGLAGGLLTELLLLLGNLAIGDGRVVAVNAAEPSDLLEHLVFGFVANERNRHSIRDWLAYLARTSTTDVAVRLERAGYLARVRARRPRRGDRWVPVDADCAFAAFGRARAALDSHRPPAAFGATLAGLAVASGLGPGLLTYGPPDCRHRLDQTTRQLPPGARELISQTQAAVDSAMLSHWR